MALGNGGPARRLGLLFRAGEMIVLLSHFLSHERTDA